MKIERIIFSVVIGALIYAFLHSKCSEQKPNELVSIDTVTVTKYDTAIVYKETIKYKTLAKIEYISDTLILERPYVASHDTIIKLDTIKIQFNSSFKDFLVEFKPAPVKVPFESQVITVTRTEVKPRAWWEVPLYYGLGVATGATTVYILKK